MMAFFLGIMANDSPGSTSADFISGASIGFLIIASPVVLITELCIRELNGFAQKKSLILNYINAALVFCSGLFPVAIWQFYTLSILGSQVKEGRG
jgi:hypothetical protein